MLRESTSWLVDPFFFYKKKELNNYHKYVINERGKRLANYFSTFNYFIHTVSLAVCIVIAPGCSYLT